MRKAKQPPHCTRAQSKRSISPCAAWVLCAATTLAFGVTAQSSDGTSVSAGPRWGQASALSGSTFLVHGGKTQGDSPGGGGFTYTSAPNSGTLLSLDLSKSFNTSVAPWTVVDLSSSSSPAPAVSFHTLSSLGDNRFLAFGGDGSPIVPIQTGNDSAFLLSLSSNASATSGHSATWTALPTGSQQPMRRIYHSAQADQAGFVWLMGGEKADGSNIALDEFWAVNTSITTASFSQAVMPPISVVDGSSTLLSDDTLIILGGVDKSGSLLSLGTIHAYSTTTKTWQQKTATGSSTSLSNSAGAEAEGSLPRPRRGHAAACLPSQRILIHGGASADLSEAYDDAWLLDWSVDPPVWTALNMTGGPGARYGHAAVAYGSNVLIALGWGGSNPADTQVHAFQGTDLVTTGVGAWTGGSWTSFYTPDPTASGASSGQGSGGSTASGGGSSSSHGSGGKKPTSSVTPSPTPEPTEDNSKGGAGTTAGAVLGAFVGVGLIVGAGYAVYRRQQAPHNWRHGDGAGGLLGGSADDAYALEKGGIGAGGAAFAGAGASGAFLSRSRSHDGGAGAAWAARNISRQQQHHGVALEGSGPALRERLAMMTGIPFLRTGATRVNSVAGQPRFAMLADEDEDTYGSTYPPSAARPHRVSGPRNRDQAKELGMYDDERDDDDEDDEQGDIAQRVRERSYGRVEQEDWDDAEAMQWSGRGGQYVTSPFEDPSDERSPTREGIMTGFLGLGASGARVSAEREGDLVSVATGETHDVGTTSSAPSSNSHLPSSNEWHAGSNTGGVLRSSGPPSSTSGSKTSSDASRPALGLVSFSDAPARNGRGVTGIGRPTSPMGARPGVSPLLKRSATWWDRFMNNSFIATSASADAPIRDPAAPPEMSFAAGGNATQISATGSASAVPRSPGTARGLDELGRQFAPENRALDSLGSSAHGRSLSSLQSAQTASSSLLEARLQGMDVVQRTRSGSTRRTYGTRSGSGSTLSDGYALAHEYGASDSTEGGVHSGSVGTNASTSTFSRSASVKSAAGEFGENWGDGGDGNESPVTATTAGHGSVSTSHGVPRTVLEEGGEDTDVTRSGMADDSETPLSAASASTSYPNPFAPTAPLRLHQQKHAPAASETPSITPATTKRARQNPLLTSPLSPPIPSPKRQVHEAGSVRERVLQIERDNLRLEREKEKARRDAAASAAAEEAEQAEGDGEAQAGRTSGKRPLSNPSGSGKEPQGKKHRQRVVYSHGLAPKQQLFVANPDGSDGA